MAYFITPILGIDHETKEKQHVLMTDKRTKLLSSAHKTSAAKGSKKAEKGEKNEKTSLKRAQSPGAGSNDTLTQPVRAGGSKCNRLDIRGAVEPPSSAASSRADNSNSPHEASGTVEESAVSSDKSDREPIQLAPAAPPVPQGPARMRVGFLSPKMSFVPSKRGPASFVPSPVGAVVSEIPSENSFYRGPGAMSFTALPRRASFVPQSRNSFGGASLGPPHVNRVESVQTQQPSMAHNGVGADRPAGPVIPAGRVQLQHTTPFHFGQYKNSAPTQQRGLAPPALRFQPTIGIHRADAQDNGKIIAHPVTANGAAPDLICLDFDGCLSLFPLTSDEDLSAFVQAGGMGSSERLNALQKALAALVNTGTKPPRICVLSLNKTLRIKVLLNLLGFGDVIKEVYGSDVAPYGANKAQRMAQLCGSRNAYLFDDNTKNVMDAARGGFGAVVAAPLCPEMLERLVVGDSKPSSSK